MEPSGEGRGSCRCHLRKEEWRARHLQMTPSPHHVTFGWPIGTLVPSLPPLRVASSITETEGYDACHLYDCRPERLRVAAAKRCAADLQDPQHQVAIDLPARLFATDREPFGD